MRQSNLLTKPEIPEHQVMMVYRDLHQELKVCINIILLGDRDCHQHPKRGKHLDMLVMIETDQNLEV